MPMGKPGKNKKIIIAGKMRGAVNVLAPVAIALRNRGHQVTTYATGNQNEATGFKGAGAYQRVEPAADEYDSIVKKADIIITGMSGHKSPDGLFVKAGNKRKIPTISLLDHNSGYVMRLGKDEINLPTVIGVMGDKAVQKMKRELGGAMGAEAAKRAKIIGWPAFDYYAARKQVFFEVQRKALLEPFNIDPEKNIYFYPTQNIRPDAEYWKNVDKPKADINKFYDYEIETTEVTLMIGSDIGVTFIMKPHPGEEFGVTEVLAERYGSVYLPADACETQELMLASYAVVAGRSSCLTEACLLDRNTGGIFPELKENDVDGFPPVSINAIPYTLEQAGVEGVLKSVTSTDGKTNSELANNRKRFSVDGRASQRVCDLVEKMLS
jgi:hypothetical protein